MRCIGERIQKPFYTTQRVFHRDIPVFQISIDAGVPPEEHYKIDKELKTLREQGALIFGRPYDYGSFLSSFIYTRSIR